MEKFRSYIKKTFNKETVKRRLPFALLSGFTFALMFFFFGVLEIFASNREEFMFAATDFIVPISVVALCVAVIAALIILILPQTPSLIVFGIIVWITFTGYLQVLFLNNSNSLVGDTGQEQNILIIIIDTVIWAAAGVAIITAAILIPQKSAFKKIFIIGLIALFVMQAASCVSQTGKIIGNVQTTVIDKQTDEAEETDALSADTDTDTDTEDISDETDTSELLSDDERTVINKKNAYLTSQGLDKVSKGKNIVILLIDRFDVSYYDDIINEDPEFFEKLDGFTYFSDNVSLYSRTWPAVPTMITGIDNDFSTDAAEYCNMAYAESPFLADLKANRYKIKLYTPKYYSYREGTSLSDIADNISVANGYTITDTGSLVRKLFMLSAYRYAPNLLKGSIGISSSSFSGIVELKGASPLYEVNDPVVCGQILENGLSFDSDGNSYIFLHFNGCHSPYNMNADAQYDEEATVLDQFRGCFKTIYHYLEQMKKLGVYDDATIIITGDHPRARDDAKIPTQPRLTALFVKTPGSKGKLAYSKAQVSQDNLIPTLVKYAGIKTERDYGRTYFEVPEDENTERYHKFELYGDPSKIVTFKITGCGDDFDNWSIESTQDLIGSIYR